MNHLQRVLFSSLALTLASPSMGMAQAPGTFQVGLGLKWNSARLPPILRTHVHARARDLPPFPMNESRFKDPRRWPPTLLIEGVVCSLRVQGGTDAIREMHSLDDLRPSDRWYCLSYFGRPWNRGDRRGPSACWTRKGQLTERSWSTPHKSRRVYAVTTYWPSGEVLMYERANRTKSVRRPDSGLREWLQEFFARDEWFEEYFARDGGLIACAYSKRDGAWRRKSAFFWAGKSVGRMEYSTKVGEHYKRVWRPK